MPRTVPLAPCPRRRLPRGGPRFIAFRAACPFCAEEDQRVCTEVPDGDCDQIACVAQASMSVPALSFALEAACPQPLVGEPKTAATVIRLGDQDGLRDAVDSTERTSCLAIVLR